MGCEMATAYASYGAKVTVVCSSSEIIPSVDPEAGKIVREALEARGVTFHMETRIVAVERPTQDEVTLTLSTGKRVSGTELLVAAGRKAKLNDLGLESVGVQANSRFLSVNENLCVPADGGQWLYAAGDINGRARLTHSSKYHAAITANAIIAHAKSEARAEMEWSSSTATADSYAIPQVIFTDPVVASVGLTRQIAAAQGKTVHQVTAPMTSPGYIIHMDNPAASWAQWLLDEENRIVGATFVGTDAAEVLHASTVAIVSGVKLERLMHAIPSFPTLSWVYYNLMDAAGV